MAQEEMIERLWAASKAGDTIRKEWLEELVWHPDGKERLRELGRTADGPTLDALMDLLHDYADASRRNASKKRRKTTEGGVSWQRELAEHLHSVGPSTKREKYLKIPKENVGDPLVLCDGKFEVTRSRMVDSDKKEVLLIQCTFDDGRAPAEITFSTFERYLKKPNEKKQGD
jgi:hypothetical protein